MEGKEMLRKASIDLISEHLQKCTVAQIEFFNKLYPGGIDSISDSKLSLVLNQILRTIQKNELKAKEQKP